MCGIVGYIGRRQAQNVLFDCLSRLEYRGYDSAGIAVRGSAIKVVKDKVRVDALRAAAPEIKGTCGIGHTRWATHGVPSMANAHPHTDCTGSLAVVHNGVITNYLELREKLAKDGCTFRSDTDTEVIPHLIDRHYQGDIVQAVEAAVLALEGSYAIAVLSEHEHKLVVARKDSPLIIGLGDGENLVASDVPAIMEFTDRIICLENGDTCVLTDKGVEVRRGGNIIERPVKVIHWDKEDIGKCGCEHYMLKEIREQPKVVHSSLTRGIPQEAKELFEKADQGLLILACGTSYHAALVGKYLLEELLGMRVTVELASEFNYLSRVPNIGTAILVTQSGETADVLAAMRRLDDAGVKTLVITNVAHSTACRAAMYAICTPAGPEVSVAATKSFLAQVAVFYQLALSSGRLDPEARPALGRELDQLPHLIQKVLDNESAIIDCARYLSSFDNAFFIGRGINLPVALEGALKLKEISYIHAEGYAAGELKHGPLALMGKEAPVVALLFRDRSYDAMMTNIKEAKSRGSPIIMVTDLDLDGHNPADKVIKVEGMDPIVSPVPTTVVMQLLAYHAARMRGCPIDFPRNLAKSVTVE